MKMKTETIEVFEMAINGIKFTRTDVTQLKDGIEIRFERTYSPSLKFGLENRIWERIN